VLDEVAEKPAVTTLTLPSDLPHHGPHRHVDGRAFPPTPRALAAHAVSSVLGPMERPTTYVEERGQVPVGPQHDTPTVPTAPTVGPPPGDKLLPAEADASGSSFAAADTNGGLVEKHAERSEPKTAPNSLS